YPEARILRSFAREQVQKIIEWHPDIIHSQSEFSTFTIAHRIAKHLEIPMVHTYHTVYEDYTHYFSPSRRVGKTAVRKFSDFILNKTNAVIAPTEKVRHLLEEYGVEAPIYTIPTGINLSSFQKASPSENLNKLRKAWNIPQDSFVLLFLGRLAKEKNIEELIRCTAAFLNDNVILLIAGDGPDRARLEQLAEDAQVSEKIRFAGMVPHQQVHDVYQLADVYVSASTSETQGLTYIEAMASGLPVLCREDDCVSDLMMSGKNGFLFENQAQFKKNLQMMMENRDILQKMSEAAQRASENFSSDIFSERILAVYGMVINEYEAEKSNSKGNMFPFEP